MPADKLVLLSPFIRRKYELLARQRGTRLGGYAHFVDLQATPCRLPIKLFCNGMHNGIHKMEFIEVAKLYKSHVFDLVEEIYGSLETVTIARIDWCVDINGISVWELARRCRIPGVKNCASFRSTDGDSVYLRRSDTHTILVYDRLARLRKKKVAYARHFRSTDRYTRFEIQLKGAGVIYRKLKDIDKFGDIDLLGEIKDLGFVSISETMPPMKRLAAIGLQSLLEVHGHQVASKQFTSSQWAYVSSTLLQNSSTDFITDLRKRMKHSVRDWLQDRIRYPRLDPNRERELQMDRSGLVGESGMETDDHSIA